MKNISPIVNTAILKKESRPLERFDYCIIGAGVIGLAIAHKLSQQFNQAKILLIESHSQYGSETSSRNSEVIHGGIYYPAKSLKAELCRQGKEQLYEFCKTYSVPHQAIGKMIIANHQDELPQLEKLHANAAQNAIKLTFLSTRQCQKLEPHVKAHTALYSADTGIIDSHIYMQTLLTLAQQQGVLYSPNTRFIEAKKRRTEFKISLATSDGVFHCLSNNIINSAGLMATQVAASIDTLAADKIPQYHYCLGHYYSYQSKSPFSHLIYPLPNKNNSGLGIHATLDLSGALRFGPDAHYIDQIDYSFRPEEQLKQTFASAIRRYFPSINIDKLQPSYTGIRPKLSAAHEAVKDFMIQDSQAHNVKGLVNLFGIESPGLTSSLAVADKVVSYFREG